MHDVFSLIYAILIISIFYALLKERRDPAETMAWMLIIMLLPAIGILAYILFGRSWRKSHEFSHKGSIVPQNLKEICQQQLHEISKPEYSELLLKNYVTLLLNNGDAALTINNRLKILNNGDEFFPAFFKDLENAKKFIHIEVFGLESGELFENLLEILTKKVSEGVEVRVIYDCVGSRALKHRDAKRMQKADIHAYSYMPVWLPHFANKFNYRNHRKIFVIDGTIGYTGGMNIADRYLHGTERGIWRDTQIRVQGGAVTMLNAVFINDWSFVSNGEFLYAPKYFPTIEISDVLPIQIATSGPDSPYATIMQAYFALYLYINSLPTS